MEHDRSLSHARPRGLPLTCKLRTVVTRVRLLQSFHSKTTVPRSEIGTFIYSGLLRPREVMYMPAGRPHKCPYCGGTDTTGKGARKTKTMGIRRIRRCKSCRRRFTPRNQKAVQQEGSQASQAGKTGSVQHETDEATEADTSEPVDSGRGEPFSTETATPTGLEEPSDEHPRLGL